LALPLNHPARVAATVIAAEAWAEDGDDIAGRLSVELDSARLAFKQAEDADYQARAASHRRSAPRPVRLSFQQRRAEQMQAVEPRPGDFPGRKGAGA
jgi:hypothetical protein